MPKLFVSYARENKRDVDQLVEHLGMMGHETWVDARLRGGQDWWEQILQRIADSDVFIAVISHASLNSTACRREFDWAETLGKPVLPVAVEPPPTALPRRFARRQIIDYTQRYQRDRAAVILQGGLGALPPAPELPELPEPPAAPLSYLTDLFDLISESDPIGHDEQHQILRQLGTALRSTDPEERRGGRDILERFSSRSDLYADVDRMIGVLKQLSDSAATASQADHWTGQALTGSASRGGSADRAPTPSAAEMPDVTTDRAADIAGVVEPTAAAQQVGKDTATHRPETPAPLRSPPDDHLSARTKPMPDGDDAPHTAAPPTIAAQGQTPPPGNVYASTLTWQRPPLEVPTHRPEPSAKGPPPTPPLSPWWRRKAVLISAGFIVTVVATVLAVTLTTTGNHPAGQTSQTSQTALPDAATLLNQSAQTTRALKSAHLVQTVAGKIPALPIKTLTSDFTTSPTTAASGNEVLTLAGSEIDANFVILDGELYATQNPNKTDGWHDFGKASDIYDPTAILKPNTGLANVLSNFSDPKVVGLETINGVQTVKITGQVSADAANKIVPQRGDIPQLIIPTSTAPTPTPTPPIAASGTVPGTAWIREDGNHELVQVTLEPSPGNSIQMTLSNWNDPVSVEKPPGV